MMYRAKVEVSLKPGHSDPEGEMAQKSLRELRYSVRSVTVSKVYTLYFETDSAEKATIEVDEMCKRLLANPIKDDYRLEIEEAE